MFAFFRVSKGNESLIPQALEVIHRDYGGHGVAELVSTTDGESTYRVEVPDA